MVGGLQTTLHELCHALKGRGVEPVVNCGFDATSRSISKSDRSDSHLGYLVVRSEDPVKALPGVASACAADAICVLTGRTTVPMIIAALQVNLPTAVYLHNVEYTQFGGVLIPDPSLLYFSNSDFTSSRIGSLFQINCHKLIPLVDPAQYQISTTRNKVLYINPTHLKGVEIMFQVANRLSDITFQVAESWIMNKKWKDYCLSRAEDLGNIEWLSSTRDMHVLYGNARILLMPSIWEETYGRCVTEAQLNGIPVVGSNRGGLPEAIGAGGVLLDADGDINNWTSAVETLFNDSEKYDELSQAALVHATRPTATPDYLVNDFIEKIEIHISENSA